MLHRFKLEPYRGKSTRYPCPSCGTRRVFARYIDTESNNDYLAEHVGRCNRESDCAYHYTPKEFFADNPDAKPVQEGRGAYTDYSVAITRSEPPKPKPRVNVPEKIFEATIKRCADANTFTTFLHLLFEDQTAKAALSRYWVGTSDGAAWWGCPEGGGECVVFWFIDVLGSIRAGQVKKFDNSGHTAKWVTGDGEKLSCTGWAHDLMKRKAEKAGLMPEWLSRYIEQGIYATCFFGEHLTGMPENFDKPIAIVEAPKTAIIASVFFPQMVWVAAGSLSYLTVERCHVLAGRRVLLFPDLGKIANKPEDIVKSGWEDDKSRTYNLWKQRGLELSNVAVFNTSSILEIGATDDQRQTGYDLADYLTSESARRDLIDKYKAEIIEFPPQTHDEYLQIWRRYSNIGLRVSDALTAQQELNQHFDKMHSAA